MTNEINKPTSKKISFIQTIVPVLLALMVFLLGLIAWGVKAEYNDGKASRKIQNQINLQVLEKYGTLDANCKENTSDVDILLKNDRRQDLMLEQHEVKLTLVDR